MKRVTLPAGHNGTFRSFPRSLNEAFPCDARSAQAIFEDADVCKYGAVWWACIAVLSVVAAAVIVAAA